MDKVSIIVPIFNTEKYFEDCICSIATQTYKNIEVILINDGSTDNSLEICKKYENEFIKVIDIKNQGVSHARNIGIENATGKYIIFVDSDDYLKKTAIENIIDSIKKTDLIICKYTLNDRFKEGNNEYILTKSEFCNNFFEYYDENLINPPVCKLYKKDIIIKNNIRFDEEYSMGEDLMFNLEYFTNCTTIAISNNEIYYYRDNPNSLTNKFISNYYDINEGLFIKIEDFLHKYIINNEELKKEYNKHLSYVLISSIQQLFLNVCDYDKYKIKAEIKSYLSKFDIKILKDIGYDKTQLNIIKRMIIKKRINSIFIFCRLKEFLKNIFKK